MKHALLLTLALAVVTACGDDETTPDDGSGGAAGSGGEGGAGPMLPSYADDLEGIYALDAYTRAEGACDVPGTSIFETLADKYLFIHTGVVSGVVLTTAASCASPSACEDALAEAQAGEVVASAFSFHVTEQIDIDTLEGEAQSTGVEQQGSCTGAETTRDILNRGGSQVGLESEVIVADPYPAPCTTAKAAAAAEGNPCTRKDALHAIKQ
jgi:hypothetical protein